jgi:peroxiredoxin
MFRKGILSALALVFLLAIGSTAAAAVDPGDKAPGFKLFGVDYKYHTLQDYADKKAVVLFFHCNHCPVTQGYEDQFSKLTKKYSPRGVQFLAVNPNPADMVKADSFPNMVKENKKENYPFPYLYDQTQEVARAYGAKVTPHIFIITFEGYGGEKQPRVVYEGSVDNRHEKPRYLKNAIEAILDGEPVPKKKTAAFGCSVKYRKKK